MKMWRGKENKLRNRRGLVMYIFLNAEHTHIIYVHKLYPRHTHVPPPPPPQLSTRAHDRVSGNVLTFSYRVGRTRRSAVPMGCYLLTWHKTNGASRVWSARCFNTSRAGRTTSPAGRGPGRQGTLRTVEKIQAPIPARGGTRDEL